MSKHYTLDELFDLFVKRMDTLRLKKEPVDRMVDLRTSKKRLQSIADESKRAVAFVGKGVKKGKRVKVVMYPVPVEGGTCYIRSLTDKDV